MAKGGWRGIPAAAADIGEGGGWGHRRGAGGWWAGTRGGREIFSMRTRTQLEKDKSSWLVSDADWQYRHRHRRHQQHTLATSAPHRHAMIIR